MIVKSMSRKTPSFGQLLAYMTIPERTGPAVTHNLAADAQDIDAVHREFLDNYRYLPPRKSGNVLYHEILSFADHDRANVTPSILEDMTRKYLDLRAPFALAFAQAHFEETDCPHVHIMISANKVGSHHRVSLSRAEFAKVKHDLEAYQRQRYPFLEHSVVFERSNPKNKKQRSPIRQRRRESERARRLAKQGCQEPSQKERVRDLIAQQLATARSGKAFFQRLKNLGLLLYKRGRHVAVQDLAGRCGASLGKGRRYRLKTLGLEEAFQNARQQWKQLQRPPQQLLTSEELEREEQLWLEHGYRDEIRDVLALRSAELTALERERLKQIRSVRFARKQERDRDPPDISR